MNEQKPVNVNDSADAQSSLNVGLGAWVSVNDRLPLDRKYLKAGYNSVRVLVSRGQLVHECEYVAWGAHEWGGPLPPDEFTHDGRKYITHWMPLPEAPNV